ncbi:MAG TPA: response regulator transcription factor [Candidatus Ventrimonas merdavium]|nr:response regulator transcription factor [Candidatus Ventrimonas merdavium]
MRILIIEEDPRLAGGIQDILRQNWFESDICTDGASGGYLVDEDAYDAVIIDGGLTEADGAAIIKQARARGCQVPVLMLTGKSQVEAVIAGLESGADYCLEKPFDSQELVAVVRSIVRRRGEILPECLTYQDLTLDQSTYCLKTGAESIQLGRKEYEIMRILMLNKEIVVSKEAILERVWGAGSDAADNIVETYISFLRKKLQTLKTNVSIVTMRHFGYRMTAGEARGGR